MDLKPIIFITMILTSVFLLKGVTGITTSTSTIVTIIFLILILGIPLLYRRKMSKGQLSNICVTLGILGTFTGILIGLLNFDTSPDQISNSIPMLLGGLKTSFITSVAGLLTGLIVRNVKLKNSEDYDNSEEWFKTLIILNREIRDSIIDLNKGILSDSKDSSILTQLQKIRMVNSDGLDELKRSFNQFADKVVENNTQSLIDALTEVMKDFNSKINEQFGENFKELNNAVKDLVVWQENYRDHVNKIQGEFDRISSNLSKVDETMENISANHEIIIQSNKDLKNIIDDFSSGIGSFAELGERALNSLPSIEENLNSITDSLQISYDNFSKSQEEIQGNVQSSVENMITQNSERIQLLDERLGQELEKSLESLGSSLATLSNKFASDYTPITENLKQILDKLDLRK